MVGQKLREQVQRHWPDLTEVPADELRIRAEDAWTPGNGSSPLACDIRRGAVMGRITAQSWRAEGRVYFEIQGPESPDAAGQGSAFILCEAIYPTKDGHRKIEQYAADRARILWQLGGKTTGYSAVLRDRYRIHCEAGRRKLSFWATERETPESILFHYREDGEESWISFRVPPCVVSKPK